MEVLLRLAQEPGGVVTRDQLFDSVWPGLYVTDHALSRCISDLRRHLGDDPAAPRYIETIRKRGYRLVAPLGPCQAERDPPPTAAAVPPRARWRGPTAWAAGGAFAALAIFGWLRSAAVAPAPSLTMTPLTSFPGSELDPALSPDGDSVAFTWSGPGGWNFDIYVQPLGDGRPQRLTSNPAEDKNPVWSPDATSVAFVRSAPHGSGIYQVRIDGGSERMLVATSSGDIPDLAWSPDGRDLYFAGRESADGPSRIERLDLHTGGRTVLTRPHPLLNGDRDLALSPNGRRLAFARAVVPGVEDLWVVAAAGGEARRLTADSTSINGLAWAPDGSSILFSSTRDGFSRLWRIDPAGGEPEAQLDLGDGAYDPSFAAGRLVFERKLYDTNVWRLLADGGNPPRPLPVIASTRWDSSPAVSPDGSRIAFTSDRTGPAGIWIGRSDGGGPVVRLAIEKPVASPAAWSPDGRELVFSLRDGGHTHLYRAAAAGERPTRLTAGPANDVAPSFSRDGRWIYFGSDRSGDWQIWKISADGGALRPMTRYGGQRALESADGATLFVSRPDRGGLWSLPLAGGARRQVLSAHQVAPLASWTVGPRSIHFVAPAGGPAATTTIYRYDLASGEVAAVSPSLSGLHVAGLGLAAAPDESFLLFGRVDRGDGDLVLVEDAAWPGRR